VFFLRSVVCFVRVFGCVMVRVLCVWPVSGNLNPNPEGWVPRRDAGCHQDMVLPKDDDDKFTPTKHLTPPPHHSSRPAAAHSHRNGDTPAAPKKRVGPVDRRRTAPPTDLAHSWATQARPRRRVWAWGRQSKGTWTDVTRIQYTPPPAPAKD